VQVAEAVLAIEGESASTLIRATKAYAAVGDAAKVKKYGAKAVAAAEKAVMGDKDAIGTLQVAAAYAASGDKDKAKAVAEKALSLVDAKNTGLKRYIEDQAKKYGVEPKVSEKKDQ
jgi:hypothetical protein